MRKTKFGNVRVFWIKLFLVALLLIDAHISKKKKQKKKLFFLFISVWMGEKHTHTHTPHTYVFFYSNFHLLLFHRRSLSCFIFYSFGCFNDTKTRVWVLVFPHMNWTIGSSVMLCLKWNAISQAFMETKWGSGSLVSLSFSFFLLKTK